MQHLMQIPGSGITVLCDRYILSILRRLHTGFHRDWTNLPAYQGSVMTITSSSFGVFSMTAIPNGDGISGFSFVFL